MIILVSLRTVYISYTWYTLYGWVHVHDTNTRPLCVVRVTCVLIESYDNRCIFTYSVCVTYLIMLSVRVWYQEWSDPLCVVYIIYIIKISAHTWYSVIYIIYIIKISARTRYSVIYILYIIKISAHTRYSVIYILYIIKISAHTWYQHSTTLCCSCGKCNHRMRRYDMIYCNCTCKVFTLYVL